MTTQPCQCDRENDLSATQTAESECPKHGTQPPGEERIVCEICKSTNAVGRYEVIEAEGGGTILLCDSCQEHTR